MIKTRDSSLIICGVFCFLFFFNLMISLKSFFSALPFRKIWSSSFHSYKRTKHDPRLWPIPSRMSSWHSILRQISCVCSRSRLEMCGVDTYCRPKLCQYHISVTDTGYFCQIHHLWWNLKLAHFSHFNIICSWVW